MSGQLLHTITFTWKPDADRAAVADLEQALRRYAATAPGLLTFACGADLGLVEGNADFAIVALFDSPEAFQAYRAAPEHQDLIRDRLLPLLASRSAVQLSHQPAIEEGAR